MPRKCFISFKTEDHKYKKYLQEHADIDMIDKSLDVPINSEDEDYIMRKLREDYLSDSTVTIHLIGTNSGENRGWNEQKFIKRELQASLYHGQGNTQNGILGVVLPEMYEMIFAGQQTCSKCAGVHSIVRINADTTVSEFFYNYYIPSTNCSWSEKDRFCVLVKWDDFIKNPEKYIEQAYEKRADPISEKTKVYP